jgi:hypothetical protein
VEECRDLRSSPLDCGACGTRCPSLVCQDGRCLSEDEADAAGKCSPGETFCNLEDGYCADLQTDALNCGACGNMCPVNNCSGGVCGGGGIQNCAPPFAVCGDACVDTSSDQLNCGTCGKACAAGETCQQGSCQATTTNAPALVCDAGLTDCGGSCVDLQTNGFHCGGCMLGCAGDQTCCLGTCVSLQTNAFHCGGCMLGCAGDQTCQDGTCVANAPVCDAGLTDCGGKCVDLSSNAFHCGGCMLGCAGNQVCSGGNCADCGEGRVSIDGRCVCPNGLTECQIQFACVDLQNDPNNCGSCFADCASGQCSGGVCVEVVGAAPAQVPCPAGKTLCGDTCVDLSSDANNCGVCGQSCTVGISPSCLNGDCRNGGVCPDDPQGAC